MTGLQREDAAFPDDIWEDLSISFARATLLGVLSPIPFLVLFVGGFALLHPEMRLIADLMHHRGPVDVILFVSSFIAGIILHEALHGLTWVVMGRKTFRDLRFGVHWASLSPYTHLAVSIPARAYRIGCLVPFLALGAVPCLVSLFTENAILLLYGAIFTIGAGGDLTVIWIIRHVDAGTPVMDHPSRVGCYRMRNSH